MLFANNLGHHQHPAVPLDVAVTVKALLLSLPLLVIVMHQHNPQAYASLLIRSRSLSSWRMSLISQSKMSVEQCGQVWRLADLNSDGKLSQREFDIAYHLIRCWMYKNLALPAKLPDCMLND